MAGEHSPPIRVMALHALAYCERLFYLEEVEEIRVADQAVYAGRGLHEELRQDEEEHGEWSSLELSSDALGLTGKVDCLRRRDGSTVPYEHKRGRSRREHGKAAAWPSDVLQVCAYAMLLEEEIGKPVAEGRVRYHADNLTVRVPVDDTARQMVRDAVLRARQLRATAQRPGVTENDRLCIRCSLAPVCLPEEERLLKDPRWDAIRLFPAELERKTIHVAEPDTKVSRSGDTLKIQPRDGKAHIFPIEEIGAVVLHGYAQMTTQALHLCAWHEVAVHWLSASQRYVTGITPGAGPVQRRIRQYDALCDPAACVELARRLVMARMQNCLRYILRASRGTDRDTSGITQALADLRTGLRQAARADDIDALRGHEGMGGRAYFAAIRSLLRLQAPEELQFNKRSRRPPKDRFNALLGFGYALLYQVVLQAILSVGLEPALGFYHTPRSSAHPLVLDLMELSRNPLWDIPLLGSISRGQWDPAADFEITPGRVWLSGNGRRKAITLFESRMQETWKHPVVGYSLSYARLIELEVRLLEKEWTGSPGLFAKMRLR